LAVAEDDLEDLDGPEAAAARGEAVARAMERLDDLGNEQVPAAKVAVEQRRMDAIRPTAMDDGDEQSDSDSEMEGSGDEHQAAEGIDDQEAMLVEEED
jgi:hypothetical protein